MSEVTLTADERRQITEEIDHAPWHYTEYGVLCSCGNPMDTDETCQTIRDTLATVEAILGTRLSNLTDECNAFSALLDSTYPPGLDAEAHRWRRVAKINEEAGEVIEALLGCVAENPRKGASHTVSDVYKELLDVAFCALAACSHLNGNGLGGDVLVDLTDHATATHARLRTALLPAPAPDDAEGKV